LPDNLRIERLDLEGLADYHCHCDYSIDATGTIDEYCQAALKRGLAELCFTTHYDAGPSLNADDAVIRINGERRPATPDNLAPYVDDVKKAAAIYLPQGLSVKLGVEFGWYPGAEEAAARLKERFGFEYVLCGIHELDGLCFCCNHCYEKCFSRFPVEVAVEHYTDQLVAAAESRLFSTIAHLDYIRKFGHKFYGPKLDDLLLQQAKERVFPALIAGNTCLEVNTSAMRRGLADFFPRIKLINAARKAGVDVHYLGSDAHRPQDVGAEFDAAAPLATMAANAWCEDRD